jgi:hypothetical protein
MASAERRVFRERAESWERQALQVQPLLALVQYLRAAPPFWTWWIDARHGI